VLKKGIMSTKDIIRKKGKRLLVPSIIFSILYYICFCNIKERGIAVCDIYDIISGFAHMWFLPMLFWCFIISNIVIKLNILSIKSIIILSIVFSILSIAPLPFQLSNSFHFLPFFLVGMFWGMGRIQSYKISKLQFLLVVILFLVSFVMLTLLNNYINSIRDDYPTYIKIIFSCLTNLNRLVYSGIGVLLVYHFMIAAKERGIKTNGFWIMLSECCFGVYLFQQFYLIYLYDYTSIAVVINYYWLPWICFLIALLLSLGSTLLIRQTSLGRKIL